MFGMLAGGISISIDPKLLDEDVTARFATIAGAEGRVLSPPELVILPTDLGRYCLAYRLVVSTGGTVVSVFVDANTGVEVLRISEIQTQSTPAVGVGKGVLGDTKKISVTKLGTVYVASDGLRPPSLQTFDMGYSLTKALGVLYQNWPLYQSDYATDSDNNWTDVTLRGILLVWGRRCRSDMQCRQAGAFQREGASQGGSQGTSTEARSEAVG